jgi:hypothetical protein
VNKNKSARIKRGKASPTTSSRHGIGDSIKT